MPPGKLPREDSSRDRIADAIGEEIDRARRVLAFGLRVPGYDIQNWRDITPNVEVVSHGLFTRACKEYRVATYACEIGQVGPAIAVVRNLYETLLALNFVLKRRLTLYKWKGQQKSPVTASRKGFNSEFRAHMYVLHLCYEKEGRYDTMHDVPGQRRLAKELRKRWNPKHTSELEQHVGTFWAARIKHARHYSGGSIRALASSLGPVFHRFHESVYGQMSTRAHAADAHDHIVDDLQTGRSRPRWCDEPDHIRAVLRLATMVFLGCVRTMHSRFHFGMLVTTGLDGLRKEMHLSDSNNER